MFENSNFVNCQQTWNLMALLVDTGQKGLPPCFHRLVGMLVHRSKPPVLWIALLCVTRPQTERRHQSVDRVTPLGKGHARFGHMHPLGSGCLWTSVDDAVHAIVGFSCFEGHLILRPGAVLWGWLLELTGYTGACSQQALGRFVAWHQEVGGALVLLQTP